MIQEQDRLQDWLIKKSQILNDTHWDKIIKAEQDLAQIDDTKRRRNLQNISLKARNDIKRFKTQLNNIPPTSNYVHQKVQEYLNYWDKSFYFMAKYANTRNIEDFGSATKSYQMVDQTLQQILGTTRSQNQIQQTQTETINQPQQIIIEKEIIREKQVIIKVRCKYCKKTYNEELDDCPHCGGTRL